MPKPNENGKKLLGLFPLDWRFELTAIPGVRWLFKKRWFPMALIMFNMLVFMLILMSGIMGGFSSGNYSFGIMIVWILWWVLLMMFFVPPTLTRVNLLRASCEVAETCPSAAR